jgi:hypothetical protein
MRSLSRCAIFSSRSNFVVENKPCQPQHRRDIDWLADRTHRNRGDVVIDGSYPLLCGWRKAAHVLNWHSNYTLSKAPFTKPKKTLIHDHLDNCIEAALNSARKTGDKPAEEFKAITRYL